MLARPRPLAGVHLACKDAGQDGGAAGQAPDAVEAREDVGEDGPAGVALEEELVGADVATGEERSGGEKEGVQHAVAVEEMVGPAGEVLRVGTVADVGAAEEGRGNLTGDDVAGGGRELGDGREVVGQDVARVDGGPVGRRVDEVVDDGVHGVGQRGRQRESVIVGICKHRRDGKPPSPRL